MLLLDCHHKMIPLFSIFSSFWVTTYPPAHELKECPIRFYATLVSSTHVNTPSLLLFVVVIWHVGPFLLNKGDSKFLCLLLFVWCKFCIRDRILRLTLRWFIMGALFNIINYLIVLCIDLPFFTTLYACIRVVYGIPTQ